MTTTQKISMDLTRRAPTPVVYAKQGDSNSRVLDISLHSSGTEWEIPANATAVIRYRKEDGTAGIYDTLPNETAAYAISGNTLSITLAPQMLTCPGLVQADVLLSGETELLATFDFQIVVEKSPVFDAELESQDYYKCITLHQINDALNALNLSSVKSVNGVGPDSSGNVAVSLGDIPPEAVSASVDAYLEGLSLPTSVNGCTGEVVLTASDVNALPISGGTITGPLVIGSGGSINAGGTKIAGVAEPTTGTDAANKDYVDKLGAHPVDTTVTVTNGSLTINTALIGAGNNGILIIKGYLSNIGSFPFCLVALLVYYPTEIAFDCAQFENESHTIGGNANSGITLTITSDSIVDGMEFTVSAKMLGNSII